MPVLHQTRTVTALVPRYLTRFSCIGAECEDNCCTGWRVTLDRKTYTAYHHSKHPALAERFAHDVKRLRSGESDMTYGRIDMLPGSGACPFMEERLCAIQKHLGEDHLSDTCSAYPRVTREFAGRYEQGLLLSCPEAARQALLAPDAFDFVESPAALRTGVLGKVRGKGVSLELINDVRIFCLKLMRTEGLELWQRLALLGVVCENMAGVMAERGEAGVRALLEEVTAMVGSGAAVQALEPMRADHAAQAMVFSTLWGGKSFAAASPLQQEVIAAVARGLGADASGQVSGERLVECYTRGIERLPEALQAAPHLLEHYLLNEMYCYLFPFDHQQPYSSYLQLVSRFGLLRLMLAAQCNTEGPLPDAAALVRTVQICCRRFEHDAAFARQVNEALLGSAWGRLEKIYGFLRT